MDGVLVAEPVGTLDGVVHVPAPVVLVHVAESGVDTTLGSDSVASCGEQLRDTGSVEASLGQTEGGAQTGATGTDNEGIVLVVLAKEGVVLADGCEVQKVRLRNARDNAIAIEGMYTYNDRVLAAHERGSLLGAERAICEDASWREESNVSLCASSSPSSALFIATSRKKRVSVGSNLPARGVEEKFLVVWNCSHKIKR